jgi:hypothetical protein
MKTSARSKIRFAVCIKNKGYEASLDVGKLYRIVSDPDAEKRGYLRIVPKPLERALVRAT